MSVWRVKYFTKGKNTPNYKDVEAESREGALARFKRTMTKPYEFIQSATLVLPPPPSPDKSSGVPHTFPNDLETIKANIVSALQEKLGRPVEPADVDFCVALTYSHTSVCTYKGTPILKWNRGWEVQHPTPELRMQRWESQD